MTVIESNTILFGYFLKNDSITNEQFTSITPKKISATEAEAAFTCSLSEMETRGIITKFIGTNNENKAIFIWILKQPLISIPQNLQITGNTAVTITNIVNDFYKQIGEKNIFCNPLQISEQDIISLVDIIEILAEKNVENNKENNIKR